MVQRSGQRSFIAELKRRNVLRAMVLYAGAVWALSQGVSQLTPALGLPGAATRWFLLACLIGFPLWIAFAWFYELTPQGFKRDNDVAVDEPTRISNARKLDFAIIGVMAVVIVLLAAGYLFRPSVPATATRAAFHPPADTIAVLPFTNLGGDPKQQYFSDGITEELTNALGQNTGLRVIAWDTASRFRDSGESVSAIARQLNVASVLTGKILRQGDEVRVIVELVDAGNGYQLWSAHYDDVVENIFALQDKISHAISGALKVRFAAARATRTVNPQAYDLVLRARALVQTGRTAKPLEEARGLLEQAVALAPDYADAHAALARVWFQLTQYSTLPLKQALPEVRAEAGKALELDPNNVDAIIAQANADTVEGKADRARAGYQRAIEIDPSNATAYLDSAIGMPARQALAQTLKATQLDPENATAQNNLATDYLNLGEYARALPASQALQRLTPQSPDAVFMLAMNYKLLHRDEEAAKAFDLARPATTDDRQLVAAGRLAYGSIVDPRLRGKALAAADALRQAKLDPFSMYDLMQVYLVLDEKDVALDLLEKSCDATPVGCDDFAINPTYLSLRGNPRFEAMAKKYAAPALSATTSSPAVSR